MQRVPVKNFFIGEGEPLAIMSGPCVIEGEDHSLRCAEVLKKMFENLHVNFIFKSSYDKANRSSYSSFRGPGIEKGLRILERIKKELDIPVVTDVHSPEEALAASAVCDIIQIPAFLCRQTDLIVTAATTGAVIQIKKGQFLAPWDMEQVVKKITSTGNHKIILVDRGTTFGYNNLVSDMRAIPIMQRLGFPVCYDATHSVQLPGAHGESTGGQREFIPVLAKAAIAAGANCLFMETHENPEKAMSDSASVLNFKDIPALISKLLQLYEVVQKN